MLRRLWVRAILAVSLAGLLAGCGTAPVSAVHHTNGEILSKTVVVHEPGLVIYRLIYWSRGYRVEAYLTLPTGRRHYPLLVQLHGGWIVSGPHTDTYVYTLPLVESQALPNAAVLFPEYRGYLESQGLPGGLQTDTENAQDAIHAAATFAHVDTHRLYFLGYSLGGGVALKLAGELPGVRAVVAVSPYVGLKTFQTYFDRHQPPAGSNFERQFNGVNAAYGMAPSKTTLAQESPNIARTVSPVLLLQGTADESVYWPTVQAFYEAMRALHKTVQLVLYPGGQHGLHTEPYQAESNQAMDKWFGRYGLSLDY